MAKKKELSPRRGFWEGLIWERSGDMNLGYVFCIVILILVAVAVLGELATGGHLSNAGWGFLITAFMGVLISSVPIARAKILAQSRLMDAASAVSNAAISMPSTSTGLITEVANLLHSDPTGKKSIAQAVNELSGSL